MAGIIFLALLALAYAAARLAHILDPKGDLA